MKIGNGQRFGLLRLVLVISAVVVGLVAEVKAAAAAHQSQQQASESYCPPQELITPCRCSQHDEDLQVWCSHSDLPRVLHGLKSVAKTINRPIDELILENNQLPSLPGRFFAPLRILRLMLRHNGLERVSNGWLNDLGDSLVEVFVVERQLRSIPVDSLMMLHKLEAVTIESEQLKRVPDFSGLHRLKYIKIDSSALIELAPNVFRDLPALETVQVIGSPRLNRLEAGLFTNLPNLRTLNFQLNGISWIHLRAMTRLPALRALDLSGNKISDAGMVGRAIKDLMRLETLKLSSNHITTLAEGSFVDLPALRELQLQENAISEMHHGAFHRTPSLKLIHLEDNFISRVHPESFLQTSGSGVEYLHLQHNEIDRVEELRSLLDALPMLKFLDLSHNRLETIPFGALRGHGTLEQLYLDHNSIRRIERDAILAMPALRELRLRNNSLSDKLPLPFWNLPGLKGLDLAENKFKRIDPPLLMGVPSLRSLDVSDNSLITINPAAFEGTPFLETINISHNELSMIHPTTFRKLDRLFEVDAGYNHLQEIIPGLPKIVERVSINRNKIANLPVPPSKAMDLPNLRMLDLGENTIQRIPRSAFKSLSQLRQLSLARNRLQTIDESSLIGLERLEQLNLQDNRLMALHENSLHSLRELRDLNIQGNRLEVFVESTLESLPVLKRLDLSRNNIIDMSANVFRESRLLQSLDLSSNNLKVIPDSVAGLTQLKMMDISFNRLNVLTPEILSSLRQLEELRASNNKVTTLPRGTFNGLPVLQYLDLSSNELAHMDGGAIRNLPQLQELVLADNQLTEIGDKVCEELPNLQAVHLQQNNLRYMSPYSFFHSPSVVYLNLSSNKFEALEHVGLRSVRNLEVLDLSNNAIRRVTTNPLRGMDWLVELKLDDNRICKVQGEPFTSMPRLRVLTMRNNKMSNVVEPTFRSLRGNLAILDLDGNPLDCTCDMIWLRAWYQETDSLTHYPGPRCNDGSMLRDMRLSRTDCANNNANNNGDSRVNQILLTNEHGDVFQRRSDFSLNECESELYDETTASNNNAPPLPGDSEYFYDQYIDYPLNDTNLLFGNHSNVNLLATDRPLQQHANLSNTILNYNKHKQQQHQQQLLQQSAHMPGSQFTFFGMPLPSLNMGNLWNFGRDAKTRSATGTKGKARVQVYKPGDLDFYKFFQRNNNNNNSSSSTDTATPRIQTQPMPYGNTAAASGKPHFDLRGTASSAQPDFSRHYYRPYFQTTFSEPTQIEMGGFRPILPGTVGGFQPIQNPLNSTEAIDEVEDDNLPSLLKDPTYLGETSSDQNEKWPEKFPDVVQLVTSSTSSTSDLSSEHSRPVHSIKSAETSESSNSNTNINNNNDHEGIIDIERETTSLTTTTTTTTKSPLQNYLADISYELSSNDEIRSTTTLAPTSKISPPTLTTSTIAPSTTRSSSQATQVLPKHPTRNISSTIDLWENLKQSPSSLSELVAPNAQLGSYRSPPPGRSTITKVFQSTPTPKAEEYHRTTPSTQNLFEAVRSTNDQSSERSSTITEEEAATKFTSYSSSFSSSSTTSSSPSSGTSVVPSSSSPSSSSSRTISSATASKPRKTNMDWYYANYNKSTSNGDGVDTFDIGLNRLRSGTKQPSFSVILMIFCYMFVVDL